MIYRKVIRLIAILFVLEALLRLVYWLPPTINPISYFLVALGLSFRVWVDTTRRKKENP